MGRSPTTRAMAGTVSGMRQMNSTMRFRRGRRRRTQTMVGSSSANIKTEVMTASSSEATIASVKPGVVAMLVQASRVRGESMLFPRVENSNIAPIGMRKNPPSTTNTTMRKMSRLRRRDLTGGSPQPLGRALLEDGVEDRHDEHCDDHGKGQSLGQTGRAGAGLAGEQRLDLKRDQHAALGDQRGRRRVGRERVGEQKQGAPEKRWKEERPSHIAPVVPRVAAQALGRLAPLGPYAIESRNEDQDHQRDLEVEINERQAAGVVQPDPVLVDVDPVLL